MKMVFENKAKIYLSAFFFFTGISLVSLAQEPCSLCDAVVKGNFNRVEKIVGQEMFQYRYGTIITNGGTSYSSYNGAFDSIVSWLNSKECVMAAAWDKCQAKILLYPGYSTIGAIFKTPDGAVEKTFLIREGKSRSIDRWLGWLHHFKARERFYYLGMKDSNGFVKLQLELCEEEKRRYGSNIKKNDTALLYSQTLIYTEDRVDKEKLIPYEDLLGTYVSTNLAGGNDTVTFTLKEKYYSVSLTRTAEKGAEYWFSNVQPQMISCIGSYSPWRLQIAKIELLSSDSIKILYSNGYDFKEANVVTYKKSGSYAKF